MHHRPLAFVLAFLFLAAPGQAQQSALSSYAALGDSLTAGVVNGSLVETHQRSSYPALLARQAGLAGFQQPTVAEPGNPAELQLVSLLPSTIISPKAPSPGAPNNTAVPRPYNNLGIPTANTPDYVSKTTDGGGPFDLVLRGLGTAVAQAVALRAAVYTVWIGNNDVLTAVVQGRAIDGVTLTTAANFRTAYSQIVTGAARHRRQAVGGHRSPTSPPFRSPPRSPRWWSTRPRDSRCWWAAIPCPSSGPRAPWPRAPSSPSPPRASSPRGSASPRASEAAAPRCRAR